MTTAYAMAALAATKMVKDGLEPPEAWRRAVALSCPSLSSQVKPCPKGAFLGLCEEGLVSGVPAAPAGSYTASQKNKDYAVRAVSILRRLPAGTVPNPATLWVNVLGGEWKQPNGQMEVVLALWTAGLIPR